MCTVYVCIQLQCTDSKLLKENMSCYTVCPGSLGLTLNVESFSCSSRQDMTKELWCVSGPALLHITAGTSEKARTFGSSSTRNLLKDTSQSPRTVAGRLQELYNPKTEVLQKASARDLHPGPQSRESTITRYVPIAYVTPQRTPTTHHSHHFHDVKAMTRLCKPRPVVQPRAASECSMWAAMRCEGTCGVG
jgi:hypothetical protein